MKSDHTIDQYPTFRFGCEHKAPHLCDGTEHLLHLLHALGLTSPTWGLKRIGISMEGKRYFWNGTLFDRGHW